MFENIAYPQKRTKEFVEEIFVLIRLLARRVGPYIVAKKVGPNVLELSNYGISSTFSVSNLVEFRTPAITPSELFELDPILMSEPTLEYPPNFPLGEKLDQAFPG